LPFFSLVYWNSKVNFVAKFKITEELGKGNVKIIPDVLIGGNGNGGDGPISGLLGLKLMDMLDPDRKLTKGDEPLN